MALSLIASRIDYCWRLAVTGLCFFGFSLGSAVLSFVLFPGLNLTARCSRVKHRRAQWLVHKSFGLLVAVLTRARVMRLDIVGEERLRSAGGALVLANHPCLLDIVVLHSLIPRACCMVKDELWQHPIVGCVVRTAGYIGNAAPEQVVDDAALVLASGIPLVVFPEGTRTRPGAPLRFQRGAAHIALASGKPILPVLLSCDPPTLLKGSRWYQIPSRPFVIRVSVRPPLHAGELAGADTDRSIAARRLTQALEGYFTRELSL
jgi:1-acyl-sn-glycerol-3-phosphate acyltransferase